MTTYASVVDRQRNSLPDHVADWVIATFSCYCPNDWIARDMHDTTCQHAVAVDVLAEAYLDGLLTEDEA